MSLACNFFSCWNSLHTRFVVAACLNIGYIMSPVLSVRKSVTDSSASDHSLSFLQNSAIFTGVSQIATSAQMFVLGPRLILSIRGYHTELVVNSDAGTDMTTIAFQAGIQVSSAMAMCSPASLQITHREGTRELSSFVNDTDLVFGNDAERWRWIFYLYNFWYKSNATGGHYYCAERTIQRPCDRQGPYSSTCCESCWGRGGVSYTWRFSGRTPTRLSMLWSLSSATSCRTSCITPQLEAVFCQHPRMEAGIPLHVFSLKVWCMPRQIVGGHREVGPSVPYISCP